MTGNKGFDQILYDFKKQAIQNGGVTFQPGTESVSSRGGYYPSSRFLEAFFDITYNLAAWEVRERRLGQCGAEVELFDNSRDRYQYCVTLAEEFEKSHPFAFGEGAYPTAQVLKSIYEAQKDSFDTQAGVVITVGDEFGDDYILAIDAFCDRKFKERTGK